MYLLAHALKSFGFLKHSRAVTGFLLGNEQEREGRLLISLLYLSALFINRSTTWYSTLISMSISYLRCDAAGHFGFPPCIFKNVF